MSDTQTPAMLCPDCGKPLEELVACGARDYFCNSCNELKSKTRVRETNAALLAAQSKENH
ncbi:YfgJ family double zinc ribbon protein [Silvimonas iriomotensis]|uniref:Uncharacterized protein n=1 Tax=Silvimonas iriomotensis TaxID=449662 RepID=A0ABQ2P732_9NEIS|nr:zinc-ribbon domain-containing protein [Silvimonas iriomotensis]GGP19760.1 hypothetical protein GCM10010970_12210 [Silvimonas iriomotensis]